MDFINKNPASLEILYIYCAYSNNQKFGISHMYEGTCIATLNCLGSKTIKIKNYQLPSLKHVKIFVVLHSSLILPYYC